MNEIKSQVEKNGRSNWGRGESRAAGGPKNVNEGRTERRFFRWRREESAEKKQAAREKPLQTITPQKGSEEAGKKRIKTFRKVSSD